MQMQQIAAVAAQAGFTGEGLVDATAVAWAESSGNPDATGNNGNSLDRGLFQINNVFHPEVTDTCAYNPLCCARAAYTISAGGTNWQPWSTWPYAAAQFLPAARLAVAALGGGSPAAPADSPANTPPSVSGWWAGLSPVRRLGAAGLALLVAWEVL